MLTTNLKLYAAIAALVVLISASVSSATLGYKFGKNSEIAKYSKEKQNELEAKLDQTNKALEDSKKIAQEFNEQSRIDLESALRASEDRQAKRNEQAVRAASIDAATRSGAYISELCKVDARTLEEINSQLRRK